VAGRHDFLQEKAGGGGGGKGAGLERRTWGRPFAIVIVVIRAWVTGVPTRQRWLHSPSPCPCGYICRQLAVQDRLVRWDNKGWRVHRLATRTDIRCLASITILNIQLSGASLLCPCCAQPIHLLPLPLPYFPSPPLRDLKPANLMISGNLHADVEQLYLDSGVVKVADFGLSKSLVPVDRHGSMSMNLTEVGGCVCVCGGGGGKGGGRRAKEGMQAKEGRGLGKRGKGRCVYGGRGCEGT
jgi:hypothetical protein